MTVADMVVSPYRRAAGPSTGHRCRPALTRLSTVRVRTVIAWDRDSHATHRATRPSAAGEGQRGEVAVDAVDVGVLDVAEHDDRDVVVGQIAVARVVALQQAGVVAVPVAL